MANETAAQRFSRLSKQRASTKESASRSGRDSRRNEKKKTKTSPELDKLQDSYGDGDLQTQYDDVQYETAVEQMEAKESATLTPMEAWHEEADKRKAAGDFKPSDEELARKATGERDDHNTTIKGKINAWEGSTGTYTTKAPKKAEETKLKKLRKDLKKQPKKSGDEDRNKLSGIEDTRSARQKIVDSINKTFDKDKKDLKDAFLNKLKAIDDLSLIHI